MPETTLTELKYLVERQREEIKTLNEVGRLLSSTVDQQRIVRLVASYLKQTFPIALCSVFFIEQKRLLGIPFAKIAQVDLAAAIRTICQTTAEHLKRPVNQDEIAVAMEEEAAGQWSQGPIGYLRSQHSAPLTFDGRFVGLLSVFSGKTDAFTKEDQHVIDIVADQLRAALRTAFLLDELTRANELKNELLMVISHELRIPLTSIKEGISLLLDGALGEVNADQQDFLKTVDENANRLETLVGKVVTATQLVTGQLQYTVAEIDFSAILREMATAFEPMAKAKGVHLELAGAEQPIRAQGDGKRLRLGLDQLVENAIQATPAEGRVTIQCADARQAAQIEILDTGRGIPEDELPGLFGQFHFVGGVDDRKTGGLGLGLFIAKAFVDAQGGTISLKSRVDQGTQVSVRLPKQPPQKSAAQAATSATA